MELLSPAGDISSLKLAIDNGADAVYLGLQNFNARRSADNFNEENIASYVKYAHLFNTKIYITLNTNVKDNEIDELKSTILACKNAKVDAFIITDLLTAKLVKELTNIPMHASTQMGINNVYGAKYLEKLGFSRVVLARETKIEDIKKIKEETNLEIEYFIHGALCVSYSGQCLFSSMISGESANRGLCKQPCRQLYKNVTNNSDYSYLLSTKDLCLINELSKLKELGIDSLKIEGRLKRDEYVGVVTNSYRVALDNINKKNINNTNLINNLKKIYNRGEFTKGYLFNDNVMYNKTQNHIGEYSAKVIESRGNNSIILGNFNEKNGYKIFRDNKELTGGKYNLIKQISSNKYLINYKGKVGDIFNVTTDNLQIESINEIKRKIILDIDIIINKYEQIKINAKYKKICINISSNFIVEKSKNNPITFNDINKIFNKTGDKHIIPNINLSLDNDCFIKLSNLNNLRKEVYNILIDKIIEQNTFTLQNNFNKNSNYNIFNNKEYFILNNNSYIEQSDSIKLVAVETNDVNINKDNLLKINILVISLKDYNKDVSVLNYYNDLIIKNKLNTKIYLKLPTVLNNYDLEIIDNILNNYSFIYGIYTNSLAGIEIAKKYNKNIFGGVGLNIYNNFSASNKDFNYFTVSTELTNKEILQINKSNKFVYAFGNLPLMTFTHCTNNNGKFNCANCNQNDSLVFKDKKFDFNILRTKINSCYFTLYNSFATNILDFCNKYNINIYLDMLQYNNEVNDILNNIFSNNKLTGSFTKGNLIRGVK